MEVFNEHRYTTRRSGHDYRQEANVPGGRQTFPIQFELGEPGVKQGQ